MAYQGRTRYELFEEHRTYAGRDWARRGDREIWKAVVSGLAAGAVATYAMTQYQTESQKLVKKIRKTDPAQEQQPQQSEQDQNSTIKVANRIARAITGREVPPDKQELAGLLVHYGFGTVMGGVYGLLSGLLPATSAGRGVAFGAGVWAAVDETALPALGVAKWWPEYPIHVHANALAAHLVYGVTTDSVQRGLRKLLDAASQPGQPERRKSQRRQYERRQEAMGEFRPVRVHPRSPTTARVQRFSRFEAA